MFSGDEVPFVLSGTAVVANPKAEEVQRAEAGILITLWMGTRQHIFAHGGAPLRVVEFLAPPPSSSTTGEFADLQPSPEALKYALDYPSTELRGEEPFSTVGLRRLPDVTRRRDLDVMTGVIARTSALTVVQLEVKPGEAWTIRKHGGDVLLMVKDGVLHVRDWLGRETYVFELEASDACFLPAEVEQEYRNFAGVMATAVAGAAPSWR